MNSESITRGSIVSPFSIYKYEQSFHRVIFKKETYFVNFSYKSKSMSMTYTFYSIDAIRKEGSLLLSNKIIGSDSAIIITLEHGRNEILVTLNYVDESVLLSNFVGTMGALISISSIINSAIFDYSIKSQLIKDLFHLFFQSQASRN